MPFGRNDKSKVGRNDSGLGGFCLIDFSATVEMKKIEKVEMTVAGMKNKKD